MIVPELPNYLSSLGGEDYKGLIISLFTMSAGLSRPFSGKLADTVGRIPLMIFGTVVCIVCSLLYPILTSVAGFLLLRFFHGFSTGFKPTAATAFAADIVPVHRRGEAMGIMGVSMNLGASLFPPLGSYLMLEFSMETMFYASSGIAILSVILLLGLKESLENPQKIRFDHLKLQRKDIIAKEAIPVAIVALFVYFSFGILLTVTPDHAEYVGMRNKGLLFTSFTIFAVLSRAIAGKVSDHYGRIPVIKLSVILVAIALVFLGFASNATLLMAASGALGFTTGIAAPAVFAWVIDISPEDSRGRYMATVYIALEIGIGVGALLSAWIYSNEYDNLKMTYISAAIITSFAFFYLQFIYSGKYR